MRYSPDHVVQVALCKVLAAKCAIDSIPEIASEWSQEAEGALHGQTDIGKLTIMGENIDDRELMQNDNSCLMHTP